jgi:hypothetical protein
MPLLTTERMVAVFDVSRMINMFDYYNLPQEHGLMIAAFMELLIKITLGNEPLKPMLTSPGSLA